MEELGFYVWLSAQSGTTDIVNTGGPWLALMQLLFLFLICYGVTKIMNNIRKK